MQHLFIPGANPPPPEYIELILCRDIYHCTPVQLREVPIADILRTLTLLKAEGKVRERKEAEAKAKK